MNKIAFAALIFLFSLSLSAETLPKIYVTDSAVATQTPAGTYKSVISDLRYEPLVDLQERNLPEAQADIAIRGGIFENTGIRLGSATLFDPQTGHYVAEIPLSPFMLNQPEIYTGVNNAIYGFNSNVGTVNYALQKIQDNLALRLGVGGYDFNSQHIYLAKQNLLNSQNPLHLNMDVDLARSELNGTRPDGEHDFERMSGRFQLLGTNSQTDLIYGYQDKFFAWQDLYALQELHDLVGSSGIESENLQSNLIFLNHRQEYNQKDYFEFSTYFREHKDDYEFDIKQPGLFNDYRHKSKVWSAGLSGKNYFEIFALNYSGQFTSDDLESSALVFGDFNSRNYTKFTIAPEKEWLLNDTDSIIFKTGLSYHDSNRDSNSFSPLASLAWVSDTEKGRKELYFEYAETSQLPGYTAIASNPEAGLFKGNQNLSREKSNSFEIGYEQRIKQHSLHLATFYRQDSDLVDWTFSKDILPFTSRTANNVDIDVFGIEAVSSHNFDILNLVLAYNWLHKNEDYKASNVDASFYALNFPEHRGTVALSTNLSESIVFRIDNEIRIQEENSLRKSNNEAWFTSAELLWDLPYLNNSSLVFSADNIWKTNFEDVPGVPGRGRLLSVSLLYDW